MKIGVTARLVTGIQSRIGAVRFSYASPERPDPIRVAPSLAPAGR